MIVKISIHFLEFIDTHKKRVKLFLKAKQIFVTEMEESSFSAERLAQKKRQYKIDVMKAPPQKQYSFTFFLRVSM